MNAEIICLYAFDIAQEADLPRIEALVTGTAEQVRLGHLKDAPPGFPMYRPIAIRDEAMPAEGPHGDQIFLHLPGVNFLTSRRSDT